MNDYVARADAVKAACKLCPFACVNTEVCPTRDVVFRAIPPADVRPVVYGEWINKRHGIGWCSAECSICGNHVGGRAIDTGFGFDYTFPKLCDNCGADMRTIGERLSDISAEEDLFPELTAEEKAENKAEAKRMIGGADI